MEAAAEGAGARIPLVSAALAEAARALMATSDTPRLDAELLMAHALGTTRDEVLLSRTGDEAAPTFEGLMRRRLAGEPVAYITGSRDFWTITLHVTPAVLIPRPETETLLEAALERFGADGPARVLDLGTGSGALVLAALDQWPRATGVGIDASDNAVAVARDNAMRLGLSARAEIRVGGWEEAANGGFDLVLCNPPYIADAERLPRGVVEHEPVSALFAGEDGLDAYRALAPLLRLPESGLACFEIGWTQARAVIALFEAQGFAASITSDLAGRDRVVLVTRSR